MTALEALRAVFAAWEAGDADALGPLFCDDGAYLDPLKAGPLNGPESIVAGNRPAMAAIEDCRITVAVELEAGERAVVEGLFTSRLVDGGARFDFPFMALVELHEGRILRLAEYFDTRTLIGDAG
jgi:ketosteroid isomerase-like protein